MPEKEKMTKEGKILAILYLVLSILLLVGPKSLFRVCPVGESLMKCYWSTQALIPLAAILFLIGGLFFLERSMEGKRALSIITMATGTMVILIPAGLIGGCGMKTMSCRSLAFPAIYLIGAVAVLSALMEIILLKKKEAEREKQERKDENR